eukprot:1336288-Amorphochlora_amoeboformis.AAC.1
MENTSQVETKWPKTLLTEAFNSRPVDRLIRSSIPKKAKRRVAYTVVAGKVSTVIGREGGVGLGKRRKQARNLRVQTPQIAFSKLLENFNKLHRDDPMGTSFSKKRDSKILSRRTIAWGGKYGVSPNSSIETPPVVKALFGEDGVGLKERIEDKAKYVKFTIRGTVYRVHERYTLHELIGTGAYGKVVSAVDSLTGKNVAIKRIPALFNDRNDAIRVLREIKVARELGDHANIVRM